MGKVLLFFAASLVWPAGLLAQSSASYKIESGVFNAGGNPTPVLTSASFKVSLDAIGDGVDATSLSSASYHSGAGLIPQYPPPGEIQGDHFADKNTLAWLADPSVGSYDVYRGTAPGFSPGFGTCLASGLAAESCAVPDAPSPGQCFFYLITARNRLAEEGTKGYESTGTERGNTSPCP